MTNALGYTPSPPPPLRTYVINFDANNTNLSSFHRYLADSRDILKFWNYIPLSYFVKTHLDANGLQERVATFVPVGFYVVVEVNPFNMQGRLPQAAWDWFYDRTPPLLPENIFAQFAALGKPPS